MDTSRKYVRYNFWVCIFKRNSDKEFTSYLQDLSPYLNKVAPLIDKGLIIFNNEPCRIYLLIYRKKPIRFDILKNRLPFFYITRLINLPSDFINAQRNINNGYIFLTKFDKKNCIPLAELLDDEEEEYIQNLDSLFSE